MRHPVEPAEDDRDAFQAVIDSWPERREVALRDLRAGSLTPATTLRPLVDPAERFRRIGLRVMEGT